MNSGLIDKEETQFEDKILPENENNIPNKRELQLKKNCDTEEVKQIGIEMKCEEEFEEKYENEDIEELKKDFLCPLCRCLICQPITPKCGHTYCKICILRYLLHSNRCPKCKIVLHISPHHGVNILLTKVATTLWPKTYEKRILSLPLSITKLKLPLLHAKFVLFPGQKVPLNITEPRYKLMLKRVLEGGGKFGIVSMINDKISNYGTYAALDSYFVMPDGNNLISVVGIQTFKVIESAVQDGYQTALVDLVHSFPSIPDLRSPLSSSPLFDSFPVNNLISSNSQNHSSSSSSPSPSPSLSPSPSPSHSPSSSSPNVKFVNNLPNIKNVNKNPEITKEEMKKIREGITNNEIELNDLHKFDEEIVFEITKELFTVKMPNVEEVVEKTFGKMPQNAIDFSYWLATILPLSIELKQFLLECSSSTSRLIEEIKILKTFKTNN